MYVSTYLRDIRNATAVETLPSTPVSVGVPSGAGNKALRRQRFAIGSSTAYQRRLPIQQQLWRCNIHAHQGSAGSFRVWAAPQVSILTLPMAWRFCYTTQSLVLVLRMASVKGKCHACTSSAALLSEGCWLSCERYIFKCTSMAVSSCMAFRIGSPAALQRIGDLGLGYPAYVCRQPIHMLHLTQNEGVHQRLDLAHPVRYSR